MTEKVSLSASCGRRGCAAAARSITFLDLAKEARRMDIYNAWFDLKPGTGDIKLSEQVATYMGHLKSEGLIEGWRLTRRKLGFGVPGLGEFHLAIEVRDMRQLEDAFERVGARRGPVEGFHFGVNSIVSNAVFALYRDFPDAFRHRGEEKF
jgi:hypothetical protein